MATTCDELKAACYVARRFAEARQHDIHLELSEDFDTLRQITHNTEGRAPLTPVFDNTVSELVEGDAFCLVGRDSDGMVVHVQAVRVDDLPEEPLSDHLRRHAGLYLSPHIPAVPRDSDFDACRYTRQMQGRVCYHGEVWLSPNGPYRGCGLAVTLPRLGVALALLRWAPDFIFGLVHPDLVLKGIPARYGYTHMHPHGVRWRLENGDWLNETITWMSRDDMRDLVEAE